VTTEGRRGSETFCGAAVFGNCVERTPDSFRPAAPPTARSSLFGPRVVSSLPPFSPILRLLIERAIRKTRTLTNGGVCAGITGYGFKHGRLGRGMWRKKDVWSSDGRAAVFVASKETVAEERAVFVLGACSPLSASIESLPPLQTNPKIVVRYKNCTMTHKSRLDRCLA